MLCMWGFGLPVLWLDVKFESKYKHKRGNAMKNYYLLIPRHVFVSQCRKTNRLRGGHTYVGVPATAGGSQGRHVS